MKLQQIVTSVLALECVAVYLSENVFSGINSVVPGGTTSVAFGWLVAAACFGFASVVFRIMRGDRIGVTKSAAPLLVFYFYFLIKLSIDVVDPTEIMSYTLGTSGGAIFGYLLGSIGSVCMQGMLELVPRRLTTRLLVNVGLFSFVCLFIVLLVVGYQDIANNLQSAHLLVSDTKGYQRSGSFLSMLFLLASLAVVGMVFVNKRHGSLENIALTLSAIAVYVITIPLVMYEGQLLGSNSVVLFVGATSVPTVAFVFLGLRGRDEAGKRVTLFKVVAIGVVAISTLAIVAWGSISYFDIDVTALRLFNFGGGGAAPTSVSARLDILESDYLQQLNYAPVFGNMAVDRLTTGVGSYAHSLPLSLLTHLGLVGFALFVLFLWMRLRELRHGDSWCGVTMGGAQRQKNFQLFIFFILLAVILVATLTAFFVWMPLWFALGLFAPPVIFRRLRRVAASNASIGGKPSKYPDFSSQHL